MKKKNNKFYNINRTIVKVVNTSANVTASPESIIRTTTTNYHTRVRGTLNVTGTDTFTKNYSSGDNYQSGNYNDDNITAIINQYKDDMTAEAANYTVPSFDEVVTDYYFKDHDEITQSGYNIVINTVLDKYQTYTINAEATAKNIKEINITLEAPYARDEVELETLYV